MSRFGTNVSREQPLVLRVKLLGDRLVVENRVRPFAGARPSAGVGLVNLAERHRLATGLEVSWAIDGDVFRVEIPLSRAPAS